MDIKDLYYADTVARYKSFSKAAESLFITQQTLSQQIRRLEEEVGFRIFERTTRNVSLTYQGKIFVEKSQMILREFETFKKDMETLKESSQQVISLGVLPTFSHLNILNIIHDLQVHNSDISINIQIYGSKHLVEMVKRGSLNAAIINSSRKQLELLQDEYEITLISEDYITAVLNANHGYAGLQEIRLSDLNDQAILLLGRDSIISERMQEVFKESGIHPRVICECPEIYSMIGMLKSEYAIGFLSSKIAASYESQQMISTPIVPRIDSITAIIYPKNTEKAETLSLLASYFNKYPEPHLLTASGC